MAGSSRDISARRSAHRRAPIGAPWAQRDAFIAALADGPRVEASSLHQLGLLWHQTGRSDAGVSLLQRATTMEEHAEWFNDLGNVRHDRGELEVAAEAFIRALELDLSGAEYWNNFGAVLQRLQRLDDAIEAFSRAVELDPDFIAALNNLGNALSARGEDEVAAEYFCRAYVLGPLDNKPLEMLGIAYYKLGRIAEAAAAYRQWLAREPNNAKAKHMLAACGDGNGPTRADDAYLKEVFDAYAEHFDEKLVDQLSYRGPQMIELALREIAPPNRLWDVLDGGCGTGLCGPFLAPYARHLTGVDLSANMLVKARERGYYDICEEAELTSHLQHHVQTYDLIALGDCLIYFGEVGDLFAAAHAALRPSGFFIFTVETLDNESTWRLNPSGRYAHAPTYLRDVLAQTGLEFVAQRAEPIRKEFGDPVAGMIITARRL
jgi:predicted TPR repeat methyltransferase